MELEREYIQDVIFGIAFLLIAIFAAYRTSIYWDWFGSGKIVTLFYLLISMTSISRTIWFFVPSDFLEGGYVPVGVIKFHSSYGFGYFISEICRIFGSLCLYTVFILLICYWSYTLQQTEISVNKLSKLKQDNKYSCINHLDTFQVVCIIAMSIFIIEAVNIFLFVFEISNLQQMLIIDASILSIISFCSLLSLLYYSYRIQVIMKLVSSTEVNPSVVAISKIQVLRIHSITFFTAVFFIGRMLLDLLFIVLALRELNHLIEHYWDIYVIIKYILEIMVLVCILVLSTDIRYSQDRSLELTPLVNSSAHGNRDIFETNDTISYGSNDFLKQISHSTRIVLPA